MVQYSAGPPSSSVYLTQSSAWRQECAPPIRGYLPTAYLLYCLTCLQRTPWKQRLAAPVVCLQDRWLGFPTSGFLAPVLPVKGQVDQGRKVDEPPLEEPVPYMTPFSLPSPSGILLQPPVASFALRSPTTCGLQRRRGEIPLPTGTKGTAIQCNHGCRGSSQTCSKDVLVLPCQVSGLLMGETNASQQTPILHLSGPVVSLKRSWLGQEVSFASARKTCDGLSSRIPL
jgi:hypothetical protein